MGAHSVPTLDRNGAQSNTNVKDFRSWDGTGNAVRDGHEGQRRGVSRAELA